MAIDFTEMSFVGSSAKLTNPSEVGLPAFLPN